MNQRHTAPPFEQLQVILVRIRDDLAHDGQTHSDLLQVELMLRGMLPLLEVGLQTRVRQDGEFDGVHEAEDSLMRVANHLFWIQLHSAAPTGEIRERLLDAAGGAETVVGYLPA